MPRKPKTSRTSENNWLLTAEQIETLVHQYVELRKTQEQAAYHAEIGTSLAAKILKHKGLTRSPWDRPRHRWMKETGAAVAKRDSRSLSEG